MYYTDKPIHAKTPADVQWRVDEFKRLRSELKIFKVKRPELSRLTGLKISSLDQYPYAPAGRIPSLLVLERMRAALEQRLSA
ncbi:hypothetical protein F9K77_07145 [Ochrobactrum sp. LMG 5442]|nr:hypothetical protein F9K77_07145 [Ochrobactrum sp. LMG 5442]